MTRRAWIVVAAVVGFWTLLLAVIGVVAVGALSGFGRGGGAWDEQVVTGDGLQKVAIVEVTGEIHGGVSDDSLFALDGTGADDVVSQLRQAAEDENVVAVIVRIDTPGGAVVASDEIYDAIERLDKPVVASMADMATSGGYYIAAATDRVIANAATLTGSIGVIMMIPNVQGAADKLGIGVAVVKSGRFKDAGSPFRPMEPEERDQFQALIDEAQTQFVQAVAAGRDLPEERVRELADGRVYSGLQAQANGLVDELGGLDEAYDAALEAAQLDRDEATLVRYTAGGGFGSLFSPFGRAPASPVEQVKQELGIGFGLKYLYLP